jgi:hypothetical protein
MRDRRVTSSELASIPLLDNATTSIYPVLYCSTAGTCSIETDNRAEQRTPRKQALRSIEMGLVLRLI